jgi:hypothetical protein
MNSLLSIRLTAVMRTTATESADYSSPNEPRSSVFCLVRLLGSLLLAWGLATGSALAAQPSAEAIELARTLPLADMHLHVYGMRTSTPDNLLDAMQRNNVRWAGGVGHYQEEMQRRLGGRYIAAMGSQAWASVFYRAGEVGLLEPGQPAFDAMFETAERLFSEGKLEGFGEIHVKNKLKSNSSFERSIALDSPVINRMYQLAGKFRGFVQIHTMGGKFGGYDEIAVMAARYPDTTTILSHCLPATGPREIEKLFAEHPNVLCEVSAQGLIHMPLGRMFNENGLKPGWAALIERHPNRFFIGTDPCCGLDPRYDEIVAELRTRFLPYLSLETMKRVAYRNAVERFGLPD